MNLINLVGGLQESNELLADPLANKGTHYNFINKKFLCKIQYIKTSPWREISHTNNFAIVDDPNLDELVALGDLCEEVANLKTIIISDQCIIWDKTAKAYISGIAGKGLAFYHTVDFNDVMKVSVSEALDIIIKMKCSDEIKQGMEIRKLNISTNK